MLSKKISQYAVHLDYHHLPENVKHMCKIAIIDWLGSVLAGSRQPPAVKIAKVVREAGGHAESTLIGFHEKNSVLGASLVNGASAHIVELDDLHRSSIFHPAAPIISAAVALGEREKISGKELMTAVVAGYETGIRIAEAVTPSHYYYWHTTGTCGTFAAAITAAKICCLTEEETIQAIGSAGTQAAGLWEFLHDGAMSKHLHPGKAAMNGILAALLAREGFTGAERILEGEKGFFRATADEYDVSKVTESLSENYRILGNSYKIYPSCRHTHGGVDLAFELIRLGLKPEDIDRIIIRTYAIAKDLVGNDNPTTPYEAKFSLPFCVAAALINRELILESFKDTHVNDPAIKELMSKCTVEISPEIDTVYPAKWPTEIEVIPKAGQKIKLRTDYPKGDPENPASPEEIKEKFKKLAFLAWPEKKALEVLHKLEHLEEIESMQTIFA